MVMTDEVAGGRDKPHVVLERAYHAQGIDTLIRCSKGEREKKRGTERILSKFRYAFTHSTLTAPLILHVLYTYTENCNT